METILAITLFGSTWWAIGILSSLIITYFISEVREDGYTSVITTIISLLLFYFWGKQTFFGFISLLSIKYILFYLLFGLIHAIFRIYFKGRYEAIKKIESPEYKSYFRIEEHIFRWWFQWPVSLLIWIVRDMISDICNYIYSKFSKIFESVFELGFKSVKTNNK